jgi:beta-phosphoglucomutase-like phosphatase (HAD superfamily)
MLGYRRCASGLQAATVAGMHSIGVSNTHPTTELRDADLVVAKLSAEIIDMLD